MTEIVKTEQKDGSQELEEALQTQIGLMKKQLSCLRIFSAVMVIAVIAMAVFTGMIFSRTERLAEKSEAVAEQAQEVAQELSEQIDSEQLKTVIANMNDILNEAKQSAEALSSVDFNTLNSAIQELHNVVEPVAKALEQLE